MRVFAGHLDDLLGVTVGWQDFALLRFSSGTTTGGDVTVPDRAVATLDGTFGSYVDSPDNGGLFSLQVSAVDDALNTIVIDAYGIDGSFSSGTYHVIAYGEQSILVGASGTSHYGALIADGAYALLGYLLYPCRRWISAPLRARSCRTAPLAAMARARTSPRTSPAAS